MSSFNPSAKAGYTKTGKSLKAVRRYYALLNQQQQKPRSPEEDKLSKRIALELKTQQDANEKRSKRDGVPLLQDAPSETTELTGVLVSPKETGPVFLAPTPPAPKSINADANKSLKSVKTAQVENQTGGGGGGCSTRLIYFLLGLVIGLLIGAAGLMLLQKYVIKTTPGPRVLITTDYPQKLL